jgi:prepilin-type N-terminal cleavage/methylation domain-containing protein/prepilin-type processing-associated H-X9-DG protein
MIKSELRFTLVELLIVIAIIALLASILLPAISRVKAKGKEIQCVSNLKQCALIFSGYIDDNRGHIFPYMTERMWIRKDYGELFKADHVNAENEKVFVCPSDNSPYGLGTGMLVSSYGVSLSIARGGKTFIPQYKKASEAFIFIDTQLSGLGDEWPVRVDPSDAERAHIYAAAPRHNNSVNILYLDMHVKNMRDPLANIPTSSSNVFWSGN